MTVWLEIIAFRPLSLAPPTTPCLARCAFIQLCIQPHPRLIPPSALIIIFPPRVTSLRRRLFLRNPSTDDNERRNKESRKLDRPASISPLLLLLCPSSPNLDWRVCSKNSPAGAGEGETWSLTSLCVGRSGSHGERKAENLHRSDPRVYVFSLLRIGREMIVLCSRFKVLVKTIENLWMSPWPSDPHIFSKSRLSLAWSFGIARRTQSVRERKVQG